MTLALDGVVAGDLPAWLVRGIAFVFGALWGSFFNVAIYRWPRGMSVVSPPSHCPSCGAPVRWYLNVPIAGYALLRGRARCCGAKLTPRYAWVELLSAVLCLALAERFVVRAPEAPLVDALIETVLYFVFAGGLVIATFVDLEWMEIPDEVSLPGAAVGLATVSLRELPGPVEAAVGAGLGFLIVQMLFVWSYEWLTGRRGMGEGDAKLLMMVGAFLGWQAVLFALLAGSIQGLIVAGIAMATGSPMIPKRPDSGPEPEPRPDSAAARPLARSAPPAEAASASEFANTASSSNSAPAGPSGSAPAAASDSAPAGPSGSAPAAASDSAPAGPSHSAPAAASDSAPAALSHSAPAAASHPPAAASHATALPSDAGPAGAAGDPARTASASGSAAAASASDVTVVPSPASASDVTVVPSPAALPAEAPWEDDSEGGPAKMVFGPMLALSALEYLFLGDPLLSWLTDILSGS